MCPFGDVALREPVSVRGVVVCLFVCLRIGFAKQFCVGISGSGRGSVGLVFRMCGLAVSVSKQVKRYTKEKGRTRREEICVLFVSVSKHVKSTKKEKSKTIKTTER